MSVSISFSLLSSSPLYDSIALDLSIYQWVDVVGLHRVRACIVTLLDKYLGVKLLGPGVHMLGLPYLAQSHYEAVVVFFSLLWGAGHFLHFSSWGFLCVLSSDKFF